MAGQVAELEAYRVGARALAGRIISAQEAERARVSRELHDETGQALTLLLVRLQLIEDIAKEPAVHRELSELRALVVSALDGVRRLTLQLGPSVLQDLGLASALEWLADRIERDAGLRVELILDRDDDRVPIEVAVAVFRVAQEALTNVVRHAHVREAAVLLKIDEQQLVLTVSDRGAGFDVAAARSDPTASIGLFGMSERVALADGVIDVRSKRGAGTQIVVRVPLTRGANT
jgi:signal transduction histidine kinase